MDIFCDSIDSVNETSRFRKIPKDPVIHLMYRRIINRIKYGNQTGFVQCCRDVECIDTNCKIIPTLVTIYKRQAIQRRRISGLSANIFPFEDLRKTDRPISKEHD